MSQKRILITGAAGFLGSHLCDRFIKEGYYVMAMDNLITGDLMNIEHLRSNPNFEFIRHDVTFPFYFEIDGIFNLACPASPIQYQKNPVQTFKTSVHGAINALGLAKRTGARILQASTSEIYGDPAMSPQTEDYWGNVNPIGIRSCYDEGKRAAETLFLPLELHSVLKTSQYNGKQLVENNTTVFEAKKINFEDLKIPMTTENLKEKLDKINLNI